MQIPQDLRKVIQKEYRKGLSISIIAKQYDVGTSTAYRIVKPIIKELGRENQKIFSNQVSDIRKEYLRLKSIYKLARRYNVTPQTIHSYIRDVRDNEVKKEIQLLKRKINKLTDFEKGFIAGLIEGEGYIGIRRLKRNNGLFILKPCIEITNTKRELLEYVQERLNGKINQKARNKNRKDCWGWSIEKQPLILVLLKDFCKYFIIKRKQAQALLTFCSLRLNNPPNSPYSNKEVVLYERLKRLNKRGIS